MEKATFIIVAICFLGIELTLLFYKPNTILAIAFIVTFLGLLAFYLFQYGELTSFSFGALSAEAKFVREKVKEVKEDSEAIKQLRAETQEYKESIEKILIDLEKAKAEIEKHKSDLVSLERGIVEITYLQHAGRNIFPNPYSQRIIDKINEILVIAVPEPSERDVFVKELQQYKPEIKSRREKDKSKK